MSPNYTKRQQLWEDLIRLSDSLNEPWMVLGDFNTIVASHERKGGSSNFSDRSQLSFRNMIDLCDLVDAGFQGSPFTWKHGNLFQWLDRVLINLRWRLKF